MSDTAYTLQNVSFSIGETPILTDVSLEIGSASCLAIVGPNGAGKTTLLKCLNRILRPDSGTIQLNGSTLDSLDQREIARQVAYVPQAADLPFTMTVFDFVLLGRYPHLSPFTSTTAEDTKAVDRALEIAGIESFRDRRIDTLSGGERQTAYIAAALAQGGGTLLLDEPTTYLDYAHQMDGLALIRRLNQDEQKTIVMVTHDINHALAVSDHIIALNCGRVVFDDTPDSLLKDGQLDSIFGTPFHILEHADRAPVIVPEERSR